MASYWIFIVVTICSFISTGLIRRYTINHNLIDIPNNRSSHTVPTARGGGLAIVLTFLVSSFVVDTSMLTNTVFWALLGASLCVAGIGFFDDYKHVPAQWRLLIHFFAAAWAVFWLGGFPPLIFFGSVIDFGLVGGLLACFYLVWLLNLYNFMDGIDGIAAIEAVTVCLGGALFFILLPNDHDLWMNSLLLLVAATAGFLFWNFPTARIFMGDVGSGFIGIVIGIMSIQSAWVASELFWGWIILLGVFIVDASVTLLRRLLRNKKLYEAHRTHAYQYAARKFNSHVFVSISVGFINIFWLLPISVLVVLKYVDGVFGVIIAYIPLVLLAVLYKAGVSELQNSE